mgnify:CR=1 FL=1
MRTLSTPFPRTMTAPFLSSAVPDGAVSLDDYERNSQHARDGGDVLPPLRTRSVMIALIHGMSSQVLVGRCAKDWGFG